VGLLLDVQRAPARAVECCGKRRAGGPGRAVWCAASASDPSGGYTIFEAIEKQLGLKLKAEKRNEKVIGVDHLGNHTD
jgi:uncharacterized protein (TIGR03435 family)